MRTWFIPRADCNHSAYTVDRRHRHICQLSRRQEVCHEYNEYLFERGDPFVMFGDRG